MMGNFRILAKALPENGLINKVRLYQQIENITDLMHCQIGKKGKMYPTIPSILTSFQSHNASKQQHFAIAINIICMSFS